MSKRSTWWPRLWWWDGKWRSLVLDVLLALACLAMPHSDNRWYSTLIAANVAVCLAALVRRRFPLPLVVLAAALLGLANSGGVAIVLGLYTVARRRGPSTSTWIAAAFGLAAAVVWAMLAQAGDDSRLLLFAILTVPAVVTPLLFGLWLYQRRALMASLRERAAQAERERDLLTDRAVTTERRRIAREMHDVVAHRVSGISLQSGALTMHTPDDRTGEVAEVIRATSASALTELREILRTLRDDTDASGGEHADPGLGEIDALVAESAAAGADVALELPDPLPETSTAVGRAAYRVVQEALTNAGKHAPAAPVRVRVASTADGLEIEVANERGGGASAVPGSGYGLVGMRERVTLAGGTVHAAPTDDGGYLVRAVLPPAQPSETS